MCQYLLSSIREESFTLNLCIFRQSLNLAVTVITRIVIPYLVKFTIAIVNFIGNFRILAFRDGWKRPRHPWPGGGWSSVHNQQLQSRSRMTMFVVLIYSWYSYRLPFLIIFFRSFRLEARGSRAQVVETSHSSPPPPQRGTPGDGVREAINLAKSK